MSNPILPLALGWLLLRGLTLLNCPLICLPGLTARCHCWIRFCAGGRGIVSLKQKPGRITQRLRPAPGRTAFGSRIMMTSGRRSVFLYIFSLKSQEAIYKKILSQGLIIICFMLFIKYSREHIYAQFAFYEKFSNRLKKGRGNSIIPFSYLVCIK
jgi:hypothetical protein